MAAVLILFFRTTKTKLPRAYAPMAQVLSPRLGCTMATFMVEGEKMSKSLGNFITVRDLLNDHQGENY